MPSVVSGLEISWAAKQISMTLNLVKGRHGMNSDFVVNAMKPTYKKADNGVGMPH